MIVATDLTKTYINAKNNRYLALKGVSLTLADGSFTGIVGKSGSGKSTLLHLLACLDRFDQGEIAYDGTAVSGLGDRQLAALRNQRIGTVLQDFALMEDRTVFDNVALPLLFARGAHNRRKRDTERALARIGITDLRDKRVMELSGGQKQRVAIARAVVNDPDYLFADEPTGALDSQTSADILAVFRQLNRDGVTVCLVTHDPDVAHICRTIVTIADGRITAIQRS